MNHILSHYCSFGACGERQEDRRQFRKTTHDPAAATTGHKLEATTNTSADNVPRRTRLKADFLATSLVGVLRFVLAGRIIMASLASTPLSRRGGTATDNADLNSSSTSIGSPTPSKAALGSTIEQRSLFHGASLEVEDTSISTPNNTGSSGTTSLYLRLQRRYPFLKRGKEQFLRIPPRIRYGLFGLWLCWKVFITIVILAALASNMSSSESALPFGYSSNVTLDNTESSRVLYIMTTLSEYNTGTRSTIKGQDRLGEILIPTLVDSVESMISPPYNYQVDVYLICGYKMSFNRQEQVRNRLPSSVGLQIWDDASPLGYDPRHSKDKLILNTRALARQHRFVIKDKFQHYDLFLAFEDDMRLTGSHIEQYLSMSSELDRLRQLAPMGLPDVPENMDDPQKMKYFGPMTRRQMDRLVPGMIRVEVLVNETSNGAQKTLDPVPMDFQFESDQTINSDILERHVDPRVCCHVNMKPNKAIPMAPPPQDLVIWETNIKAFSLRQMPRVPSMNKNIVPSQPPLSLDWVVLMLGPGKHLDKADMLGGYWSGREGAFGKEFKKPSGAPPELIAQQGGWMATQSQIARLNNNHQSKQPLCMGNFLPPYDQPTYHGDGQHSMNVEFWSGGYQLFTGKWV